MKKTDVILLTESCYENPTKIDEYVQNVLTEDGLVKKALERLGCSVEIIPWDKSYDWSSAYIAVFRTTWDYFHRFKEFSKWLNDVKTKIILEKMKSDEERHSNTARQSGATEIPEKVKKIMELTANIMKEVSFRL